jgi:hypothetical protein
VSAALTLLAQIKLPGLDASGPDDLDQLLSIFYLLFGVGFFVAVLGHITKLRALVAIGIVLIFAGTGAFMIAVGSHG